MDIFNLTSHMTLCTIFLPDPIVVGYELTVYTTSEGEEEVELCAIVHDPPSGGAPRPFVISSTTRNGSACRSQGTSVMYVV